MAKGILVGLPNSLTAEQEKAVLDMKGFIAKHDDISKYGYFVHKGWLYIMTSIICTAMPFTGWKTIDDGEYEWSDEAGLTRKDIVSEIMMAKILKLQEPSETYHLYRDVLKDMLPVVITQGYEWNTSIGVSGRVLRMLQKYDVMKLYIPVKSKEFFICVTGAGVVFYVAPMAFQTMGYEPDIDFRLNERLFQVWGNGAM